MKKLLYFLIGVLISACLMIPFAKADCGDFSSLSDYENSGHYSDSTAARDSINNAIAALSAGLSCGSLGTGPRILHKHVRANYELNGVTYAHGWFHYHCCTDSGCGPYEKFWYASYGTKRPCAPDSDGDGIPDQFDMYPNDPTPYNFQTLAYYVNDLGKEIPLSIVTDQFTQGNINPITGQPMGDCFKVKDCPEGETEALAIGNIWNSSADLEDFLVQSYTNEDVAGFTFPEDENPIIGAPPITNAPTTGAPSTPFAPGIVTDGKVSDPGDSDAQSQGKIVDNTSDIVKNQGIQSGYLKDINKQLQDLNKRQALSGGAQGNEDGLTKQDIEDVVNKPGESYSDNTTDNLETHDYGTKLDEIKTQYSDRATTFIDNMKESDLFALPFDFF